MTTTDLHETAPAGSLAPRRVGADPVSRFSQAQARTFLDELKNGTRNYRTIESVLRQVTAEYRGRTVVELLQNAHDALDQAGEDDPRCVHFELVEGSTPWLLVANTGVGFNDANFRGIAELGQSPKDPNESVGNKGLGFRSVLNVGRWPQIWSTPATPGAPAYRFRFGPEALVAVRALLDELPKVGLAAECPFVLGEPAVDWTPGSLAVFRQNLALQDAADEACEALSAYQFPLAATDPPPRVLELLTEGYATVIAIPVDGGPTADLTAALDAVEAQLTELAPRSLVFLHQLRRVSISVTPTGGTTRHRVLVRRPAATAPDESVVPRDVAVWEEGCTAIPPLAERLAPPGDASHYLVWSRVMGGETDPDGASRIEAAVAGLPNRWPELRRATVSLATRRGPEPESGALVIFLPTTLHTGGHALLNAPLYGSLDRRSVNFDEPINALLLRGLVELAVDAVAGLAEGELNPDRMRAAIDLVGSVGNFAGRNDRWLDRVQSAVARRPDLPGLGGWAILGAEQGWAGPCSLRLRPDLGDHDDSVRAAVIAAIGVSLVNSALDGRRDAVEALLRHIGREPDLVSNEWATMAESLCLRQQATPVFADWHETLDTLRQVLPLALCAPPRMKGTILSDPLRGKKVLPTESGLISLGSRTRVFFPPVVGVYELGSMPPVPPSLKKRVAFLHSDIRTREAGHGSRNTEVHRFLDDRVASFERAVLIRDIALKSVPALPVAHGTAEAVLCSEILAWCLALAGPDPEGETRRLLGELPAPTIAGWRQLRETMFGPGWSGPVPDALAVLLPELPEEARSAEEARLLLPPDDPRWPGRAPDQDLLAELGVRRHMPLRPVVVPGPWHMTKGGAGQFQPACPDGLPEPLWTEWRRAVGPGVKAYYPGGFDYQLGPMSLLPLLILVSKLSKKARNALAEVVLASIPHWAGDWREVAWHKTTGNSDSGKVTSPMAHWLASLPWLASGPDSPKPLGERWYVPPELLAGRRFAYAHLDPLGEDLARRLDRDQPLRTALTAVGLCLYPTGDVRSDSRLLEALARAVDLDLVPVGSRDIFLGQVREAWERFDEKQTLPRRVVVQTGRRTFEVRANSDLRNVFVPDHQARSRVLVQRGLPMVPIRPEPAKKHAQALVRQGQALCASDLEARVLADGQPVRDTDGQHLSESELAWLPVVLLALAAYGGGASRGLTSRWRDALARLRSARLQICEELSEQLIHQSLADPVAAVSPAAAWVGERVLVLRRDALADLVLLAEASEAILDRGDLRPGLKLVLGALTAGRYQSEDTIAAALALCDIDEPELATVRAEWHGRGGLAHDRLRPLLRLLDMEDAGLDGLDGRKQTLEDWLEERVPDAERASALANLAWKAKDDAEMGEGAWRLLGEPVTLPRWNSALAASNREPVTGRDPAGQATQHRLALAPLLRAVAAHRARELDTAALYARLGVAELDQANLDDWAARHWVVPLRSVLHALSATWPKEHRDWLPEQGPIKLEDLQSHLECLGVPLRPDPQNVAADNRVALQQTVDRLLALAGAWGKCRVPSVGELTLAPDAYLAPYGSAALLRLALEALGEPELTVLLEACQDLEEARACLGLTKVDVETANERQRQEVACRDRQERTFKVAGESFVLDEGNLGALLQRLDQLEPPEGGPDPLGGETTELGPAPPTDGGGGNGGPPGTKVFHGSAKKYAERLVGILGEMHARRWLRARFGESSVPDEAWVSGIRREVRPPLPDQLDTCDDRLGYDFRIVRDGHIWKVEVKSTIDGSTFFELGSSQVREASRCVGRKEETWVVLRVSHALSERPVFEWLPNPFEPRARDRYSLSRAGMKVGYARVSKGK